MMKIRGASEKARAGHSLVLSAGLLTILVFATLAGPTFAMSPRSSGSISSGLSKIILGVNAWPGSAQVVSISAGIQYYRLGISFNNATIQTVNLQARTTGVDYLGILDEGTLGVVRGGSAFHKSCSVNCNWTLTDWNDSIRRALADFPTIHEWELWNEPYSSTQHSGYLNSAATYFEMAKSAFAIIKTFDKNDTVVCLGGSAVADASAMTFTKAVWSYGAGNYCDAISLHAYISGTALFNTSAYERSMWPKNLAEFENVTHKPIWITEYGRQSAGTGTTQHYSQANQNDFFVQTTSLFANLSFIKRGYVYNLAGLSNPPDNFDFGLLNATTLKPKLVWTTFTHDYAKSLSHTMVPTVTEKAPTLHIASLIIAKLLPDNVSATAPSRVDPIVLLVNGVAKASGNGSVTYTFVGSVLKKFEIVALDKFTGLNATKTITVT
jgi:hypothetical protein